ncbi:universal stress protein F [Agrobacterium larrymoorei]|uniref:Universal stress protein n=1 Tax=Agrobacterium larrymoorei TaxID=160699 RepID=A0AAJ2BSD6_9HYPH|nr:universal stress protein [Agrobacterium larrymoorei]MDR6104600.1 universal stress protein F [Agrobacterium larrymoorei]
MYGKILVPVDLSNASKAERAVKKAEALLDQGGQIVLMNVVEDLPGYLAIDVPMDIIENAVKDAKSQLAVLKEKSPHIASTEIRSGAPAREILALAEEIGVDLIIVSSHTPDFTNYFIGSTADRVVRHAKCSVLVDR